MSQPDRKTLIRQYKENPRPAGIFQVRNTATGRLLLGISPDLPGMLNRQKFQLEMGSHPDKELQADWNTLGADAFAFEIVDQLEPGDDPTADLTEELRVLLQMRIEQMPGSDLYPQSKRGL